MARNRNVNVIQPDGRANVWALMKPLAARRSGAGPDRELPRVAQSSIRCVTAGRGEGAARGLEMPDRISARARGRSEHRGAIVAMNLKSAIDPPDSQTRLGQDDPISRPSRCLSGPRLQDSEGTGKGGPEKAIPSLRTSPLLRRGDEIRELLSESGEEIRYLSSGGVGA